jgi:hypothetical protein
MSDRCIGARRLVTYLFNLLTALSPRYIRRVQWCHVPRTQLPRDFLHTNFMDFVAASKAAIEIGSFFQRVQGKSDEPEYYCVSPKYKASRLRFGESAGSSPL